MKEKQCPAGILLKEPALLHDGQRSLVGDHLTEHRCELDEIPEHDWHEEGETRWQTY